MPNIKNTQRISNILIEKQIHMFCPMGKDTYKADITIDIIPDKEIMDYCETDAFIKSMNHAPFIIEDAVAVIYAHILDTIKPLYLEVTIHASEGAHMPVTVSKQMQPAYENEEGEH